MAQMSFIETIYRSCIMRPVLLAIVIMFAGLAPVAAQPVPALPSLTYPEAGVFCGLLKLCSQTEAASDKQG